MEILCYDALSEAERARRREQINAGDWRAARYLYRQLCAGTFRARYGPHARVLLLTDGDALAAFCTLADRDEMDTPQWTPWIGFVYTFPGYRGGRLSGTLIRHACALAKAEGHARIYLSSDHVGLYEKYGFCPLARVKNDWGEDTQVFVRSLDVI